MRWVPASGAGAHSPVPSGRTARVLVAASGQTARIRRAHQRATQRQSVVPLGGPDFSVHVYATNDHVHDADELARRYDDRAGIETIISELKGGFGIGKVSTDCFDANEAAFLMKVLAFNLFRRWVQTHHRGLATWRTPWVRRVCVQVP